ncbi:CRISPR-associated helicase Cas3' [Streptomyces sp. NPDC059850]|uniref:CRISPR-associated helicase Cas3' n=1 Tax=Streptomyces sp. NPDC059850 TaxID=3346970 RepID=UPI00364C4972
MIDHQKPASGVCRWLLPWGKTDREGTSRARGEEPWNPLFAHLLDTAACAGELWDRYLSASVRGRLTEAFGDGDVALARRVVMFFAALHDLGKASNCFLRQFGKHARYAKDAEALRRAGVRWESAARAAQLPLAARLDAEPFARHEHMTAACLPRLLGCTCYGCLGNGPRREGLHTVATLLGGHHGHIPNADVIGNALKAARPRVWEPVHRAILDGLARMLDLDLTRLPRVVRPERPSALPLFAGLVVLADWVASDVSRFTYRRLEQPVEEWWDDSKAQAAQAVTDLRLEAWRPEPTTWSSMFTDTPTPLPFQAAAIAALPTDGPALVLIETDTGSGKTRLALSCAQHLARSCGHHGLYMAMPTRAATDQTAQEIRSFLGTSLGSSTTANLAVVHHTAGATPLVHQLIDGARGVQGDVDSLSSLDSISDPTLEYGDLVQAKHTVLDPWYLLRCRGLVSPFGIGTVDQITLASQPSRHWFLRLFGLANKTVIIDEAHAYELFQRCLLSATVSWLADAGASVVVLSATLPLEARQALITAWCAGHRTTPDEHGDAGPITVVDQHGSVRPTAPIEQPAPTDTTVDLLPDPGPDELARSLLVEAAAGGIMTVVRNRVSSARDLYTALLKQATVYGWDSSEILLAHGQLLPRDRLPVEERITTLLGLHGDDRQIRNPLRPERLIVIGTQIIEQSLDIDADRLYTDLAPIDLLLQRRGRLHRHAVNDAGRPAGFQEARVTVLWNRGADGLPLVEPPGSRFEEPGNSDGYVYAPYTLAATWRTLRERVAADGRIRISTPSDTKKLIDSAYAPPTVNASGLLGTLLTRTWADWQTELADQDSNAHSRTFLPYSDGTPIEVTSLVSGEANGDGEAGADARGSGARGLAALSRLGEPTTDVIVLYQQDGGELTYDAVGDVPADLRDHRAQEAEESRVAHRAQQRALLSNTLAVPHSWFHGDDPLPPPATWQPLPHSAVHYRATLVLAPNGRCIRGPRGRLVYSPSTGLMRLPSAGGRAG